MILLGKGISVKFDSEGNFRDEIKKCWDEYGQDGTLQELLSLSNNKISGLIGLNLNATDDEIPCFDYIICVSCDKQEDKYKSYKVLEQNYAVFSCKMDELSKTWEDIYKNGVLSHEIYFGKPMLEIYPSQTDVLIYIPIK